MSRSDFWIVPVGNEWGLKLELATDPFARFQSRDEAIMAGMALAKRCHSRVVELHADGRVDRRESFVGVPKPPTKEQASEREP